MLIQSAEAWRELIACNHRGTLAAAECHFSASTWPNQAHSFCLTYTSFLDRCLVFGRECARNKYFRQFVSGYCDVGVVVSQNRFLRATFCASFVSCSGDHARIQICTPESLRLSWCSSLIKSQANEQHNLCFRLFLPKWFLHWFYSRKMRLSYIQSTRSFRAVERRAGMSSFQCFHCQTADMCDHACLWK